MLTNSRPWGGRGEIRLRIPSLETISAEMAWQVTAEAARWLLEPDGSCELLETARDDLLPGLSSRVEDAVEGVEKWRIEERASATREEIEEVVEELAESLLMDGGGGEGEGEDEDEEGEPRKESEDAKMPPEESPSSPHLMRLIPSLRTAEVAEKIPEKDLQELSRRLETRQWGQLLRLIGRLSSAAWGPTARVPSRAREDVTGIERGDDPSRILPSELARLGIPELEAMALLDLVEKKMLQISFKGTEARSNGPICVGADLSPSMDDPSGLKIPAGGGPEISMTRKELLVVLLLAMVKIADVQRREIFVVGFADRNLWELRIRTPKEAVSACLYLMSGPKCGNGTEYDPPLTRLFSEASRKKDADVLMITDGEAEISDDVRLKIRVSRKSSGARLFSLLLVSGDSPLIEVSDVVTRLDSWSDLETLADQVARR